MAVIEPKILANSKWESLSKYSETIMESDKKKKNSSKDWCIIINPYESSNSALNLF